MIIDVYTQAGFSERGELTAEDLIRYADDCGVRHVLVAHSERDAGQRRLDEADANLACSKVCRADPRLHPLYWLRPGMVDSHPQVFAGALAEAGFAGAVLSPCDHGYRLDDVDRLSPYLKVLAECDRPLIIRLSRDTPAPVDALAALSRMHAGLPMVLCGALANVRRHDLLEITVNAARRNDGRLLVDASHATADDVLAAASAIDHLVFGSSLNRPGDADRARIRELLARLEQDLPRDAYKKLVSVNMQSLLGFKQESSAKVESAPSAEPG